MSKFNPHRDMKISKVKAHHMYIKPKKEKLVNNKYMDDNDSGYKDTAPWELSHVKGLGQGVVKTKKKETDVFDMNNDGKPLKTEKKSKVEKESRAFIMHDGKKYHEIGSEAFG